jgi:hypothetical protein
MFESTSSFGGRAASRQRQRRLRLIRQYARNSGETRPPRGSQCDARKTDPVSTRGVRDPAIPSQGPVDAAPPRPSTFSALPTCADPTVSPEFNFHEEGPLVGC